MVEDSVVDVGESRSGIELDGEEDAAASDEDGVEVSGVVEVDVVLEADSEVDVVDIATTSVDEEVGMLDEDGVRSVDAEEDAVLEAELDAVEEDVESVEVGVEEEESTVESDEEEIDDD